MAGISMRLHQSGVKAASRSSNRNRRRKSEKASAKSSVAHGFYQRKENISISGSKA